MKCFRVLLSFVFIFSTAMAEASPIDDLNRLAQKIPVSPYGASQWTCDEIQAAFRGERSAPDAIKYWENLFEARPGDIPTPLQQVLKPYKDFSDKVTEFTRNNAGFEEIRLPFNLRNPILTPMLDALIEPADHQPWPAVYTLANLASSFRAGVPVNLSPEKKKILVLLNSSLEMGGEKPDLTSVRNQEILKLPFVNQSVSADLDRASHAREDMMADFMLMLGSVKLRAYCVGKLTEGLEDYKKKCPSGFEKMVHMRFMDLAEDTTPVPIPANASCEQALLQSDSSGRFAGEVGDLKFALFQKYNLLFSNQPWETYMLESYLEAMKLYPARFFKTLPVTYAIQQQHGKFMTAASAWPLLNLMTFYKSSMSDEDTHVILHELAHIWEGANFKFDDYVYKYPVADEPAYMKEWKALSQWRPYHFIDDTTLGAAYATSATNFVSDYARNNLLEDFAETLSTTVDNREQAMAKAPEKVRFVEKYVLGSGQ